MGLSILELVVAELSFVDPLVTRQAYRQELEEKFVAHVDIGQMMNVNRTLESAALTHSIGPPDYATTDLLPLVAFKMFAIFSPPFGAPLRP